MSELIGVAPDAVVSKNSAKPLSSRKLRCSCEVNPAGVYFSAWLPLAFPYSI